MTILITGGTGYLGSYVVARLLETHHQRVALLVRGKDQDDGARRLWAALQLHMPFETFERFLRTQIEIYLGDITLPNCGLDPRSYDRLTGSIDSVIHVAASLNRRSSRSCLNVNLRGTLAVIQLARAAHTRQRLRRFSTVSTTAVAGERNHELVREDASIDWERRDYDPYAQTKKFCEHMVETLLPDVPTTIFRPSTVIGDTRFGATTQFDMVRAVLMLARMRVLPLHPNARHDIVPADYVGHAIADIHEHPEPRHRIYHLSAGEGSETHQALIERLRLRGRPLEYKFVPSLEAPFGRLMTVLSNTPRGLGVSGTASLLRVFWPYVVFDTVFDNRRVVEQLDRVPRPFSEYANRVLDFAIEHDFAFPFQPWPEARPVAEVAPCPA
jgi:thioester reductase-like protein